MNNEHYRIRNVMRPYYGSIVACKLCDWESSVLWESTQGQARTVASNQGKEHYVTVHASKEG